MVIEESLDKLLERNKGKDSYYFIRILTDYITYDINLVLSSPLGEYIDMENIVTVSNELEVKQFLGNYCGGYEIEKQFMAPLINNI